MRTARLWPVAMALALALAGCGAGSVPATPTGEVSGESAAPTAEESAPPAATEVGDPATALDWTYPDITSQDFSVVFDQVCGGASLSGFAAYQGDSHPLVMGAQSGWDYEGDLLLSPPAWAEPPRLGDFQLVACTASESSPAPSCGTYRGSDGATGEMLRTQDSVTVRIVVVSTGREVGRTTLIDVPECPDKVIVTGSPPWTKEGAVGIDKILPFLTEYATGAPR